LLDATVRHGFVPDWAEARSGEGYQPLDGRDVDGRGSYAAIRVYLWSALDAPSSARARSLARLRPFLQTIGTSALPEWFDPRSGEFGGRGGRAHQAALLPLLRLFDPHRGAAVAAQLRAPPVIAADGSRYYSDVLTLIALGADDGRYAIAPDGRLLSGRRQCRS
jgi:endo-1,4-beta-D-glucanase Y